MKYKTNPCTIEAIQWKGDNEKEVEEFIGAKNVKFTYKVLDGYSVREVGERPRKEDDLCCAYAYVYTTSNGMCKLKQGDYILLSRYGEIDVRKKFVFERDFEKLEENEHI